MELLKQPDKIAWTREASLPGGDITGADFKVFLESQTDRYDFLPDSLLRRYAAAYGTRIERFLDGASSLDDLGEHYGDNVYEAEIIYLLHFEMAKTAEDVLWRRSKLGLHVSEGTRKNLEGAIPGLLSRIENL